jgi:DNA-binding MarR family transcriptional regulator
MSDATTAAAPVAATAAAAPVKKVVKKAVKKAATKKAVKKVATKKAATKTAPPVKTAPAKKDGLRKPQMRILIALAKKDALTRTEISTKATVDLAALVEYLGSHDPAKRQENDVKHFPSLISLGLVKPSQHDEGGKDVIRYNLTAAGRKKAAE